jgi:hypothetical protein
MMEKLFNRERSHKSTFESSPRGVSIMQNPFARISNPALREGLLFGIVAGILEVIFSFINLGSLGTFIALALFLVFGLIAGTRASQQTGKMSTGALAGLWVGLFSTAIYAIIVSSYTFATLNVQLQDLQRSIDQQHLNIKATDQLIFFGVVVTIIITLVLSALFGLAGGAIGGSMGRRRAQLPPSPEYQEAMFEPPPPPPPAQE